MRAEAFSPLPGGGVVRTAIALCSVALAGCQSLPWRGPPAAEDLLARSIAYHDPEGVWGERLLHLEILESRPDTAERTTRLTIDPTVPLFELERRQGDQVMEGRIAPGECYWNLAAGDFSSEQVNDLSCASLQRTRDYYLYLWGLPMKLRDPGTRLGPVTRVEVAGRARFRLRVTYDPEVGTDVWHLDFDPRTWALAGYRFVHDEAAGDGEWITLEGEIEGAGLRLPRTRTWYAHADAELLGEDRLAVLE